MTGSRPVSVIEEGLISKKTTKQTKSKQTKKQKVTKTTTNLEPKRSTKNLETMPPNAIGNEEGNRGEQSDLGIQTRVDRQQSIPLPYFIPTAQER